MLPMKMKIDKKLLPIKGHFFLYNAGTAPLVPYLSTYARQLGFSSATVGLIYTILPIFGLIAKPLFGVIADRFKIQKPIFLLFQIVTLISFSAIYFIPENASKLTAELDCGDGATMLKSCYKTAEEIDSCKIISLGNQNGTAECRMKCDMTSPKMWQTVCEHWDIPQYCYSNTESIEYTSYVSNVTLRDKCAYIASHNVTLEGYNFKPSCRIGNGFIDINEPCSLKCGNQQLAGIIGQDKANMTCVNNTLNYRLCNGNTSKENVVEMNQPDQCKASCELDKAQPWKLMEICLGWGADVTNACKPKTRAGEHLPDNLSFTGVVRLSKTVTEHNCVYLRLDHIVMDDGTIHYPDCVSKAQYEMELSLFHPACEISCNNAQINELLQAAADSTSEETNQYTKQFWLFFMLMLISWVGQAVTVTFADAICFNLLGTRVSQYGKQRLWGSVGFGLFSLLTGSLIDVFSDGAYKDYTIAFILMFVFMCGSVIVSWFVRVESTKFSVNILADVGSLLKSLHTCVFIAWTIAVGLCTGLIWQFLSWHIEDVARLTCDGADYMKTLQGLVSAIQTFCGEIPFMFLSGYILKKLGHINMMTVVLFAFGVRFVLYSVVTNAWWILPIEMLQGITFGMFYPTMTSYANVVSPPGTETTVQGLVGAIFEGIGTSLGSFIGGRLYETYGGWNTFRWFGYGAFVACVVHALTQYLIKDKHSHVELNQGYSSVIHYGHTNDAVHILDDLDGES
ncbi:major facilitator superfamily domain-containing protein 6 [Zerene cesonia]|uniref:major facilitator superfamily domain-containing protein 6 n=1 Tax=Zerene cesonia TaxID=33412 RepID=UPI0018E59CC0|nr:major facilitator superfamily domain-containing protein 6 [Zerene cesonia]